MFSRLPVITTFLCLFTFAGFVAAEGAAADGYVGIGINEDELDNGKVIIEAVARDSAAAKAGLKRGDRILKIGDTEVTDLKTLIDAVRKNKPGDEVKFKIERDGKEEEIKVKIGERPK
jgi:putative serine protease PepD